MREVDYVRPSSIHEAAALLAGSSGALALAGGTDLVVARQAGKIDPACLVDISRIAGLDTIQDDAGGLRIGSMVTMTSLSRSPEVRALYPAIADAAGRMGCWQVRNLATLGGNLCNASPSAEMGPPLLIYDATALIQGPAAEREIPMAGFFVGPGATVLERGELVTAVRVPAPPSGLRSAYERRAIRRSMDIPLVNAAVALRLNGDVIVEARVALGAVAPVPFRVPAAEEELVGNRLDANTIQAAADAACCPARPITDVRATAEYRLAMVEVLVRRALERLAKDIA